MDRLVSFQCQARKSCFQMLIVRIVRRPDILLYSSEVLRDTVNAVCQRRTGVNRLLHVVDKIGVQERARVRGHQSGHQG